MSGPDLITTSIDRRAGVSVLSVGGEIDAGTAPVFEAAIADVLEKHPTTLVIDLSAVTFLGSAGLRTLVMTHQKVSKTGGFAVVADSPATMRPIQLMDLDEVFVVYSTVDDALATVARWPPWADRE